MARKHVATVVGIGHTKVTRRAEIPLGIMALDAARQAIEDAGLADVDIDGVTSTPTLPFETELTLVDGEHFVTAHLVQRLLGIRATWADNNEFMVGHSFVTAVEAIESGRCTHALVVRAMHNPAGVYGETAGLESRGAHQYTTPYGDFYVAQFAQLWTRYQHVYGSGTRAQMAPFVVQARRQGLLNPDGYWSNFKPVGLSEHEYLDARIVSSPLSLYDCDIPLQGAAAFVLTTADRARDLKEEVAFVQGVANPGTPTKTNIGVWDLDSEEAAARRIADLLWADSGLHPQDISTADLYDGFSILAPLWLEGLGFCGRGEAFEFIQDGRIGPGGSLPLNLGGGNLGAGRMHGVPHLMSAVRQVMGRAGAAQIQDAAYSVATIGTPSYSAAVVFGREPGE